MGMFFVINILLMFSKLIGDIDHYIAISLDLPRNKIAKLSLLTGAEGLNSRLADTCWRLNSVVPFKSHTLCITLFWKFSRTKKWQVRTVHNWLIHSRLPYFPTYARPNSGLEQQKHWHHHVRAKIIVCLGTIWSYEKAWFLANMHLSFSRWKAESCNCRDRIFLPGLFSLFK